MRSKALALALVVMIHSFSAIAAPTATANAQLSEVTAASTKSAPAEKMPSIPVPSKDLYELQKLKIQQDLKDDLTNWAQRSASIAALLFALVGIIGVRALVREMVDSELATARQASNDAQASGALARELIREAREDLNRYRSLVTSAAETAERISADLTQLSSRVESEGERSVAAAEIKISALSEQIEELQKTLAQLATESESHRSLALEAEKTFLRMRQESVHKQENFEQNGKVNITLVPYSDGETAQEASLVRTMLSERGYRVSMSPWGYSTPKELKGTMKVEFHPDLETQAKIVADKAAPVLRDRLDPTNVRFVKNPRPLSKPTPQIVLFWE